MAKPKEQETGPESKFREALLPMVADVIRARTILGVHAKIVGLFEISFDLAADAIAPPAEFEDFRHELRHTAAIEASAAVVTAIGQSNAGTALREHVGLVLDAFLSLRVDPSAAPLRRLDQTGAFVPVELDQ